MRLFRGKHRDDLASVISNRGAAVYERVAAVLFVEFSVLPGGRCYRGSDDILQSHGRMEAIAADATTNVPHLFILLFVFVISDIKRVSITPY